MVDLKMPMSPTVKKTNFKGTAEYSLCILKYLKNKYKDSCIIIPKLKKSKNLKHTDVSLRWIQLSEKEGHFSVPDKYWDIFSSCINKRFVVFPFGFSCSNFMGHANFMIYDRKTKSLERFEPYGKTLRKCSNPVNLDKKMKKLFNDNLGDDFVQKYYQPLDFMSKESFQRQQEYENQVNKDDPKGGFCVAWSCWYAELRLSNPDKCRNFIVNNAFKKLKEEESLTRYIRNYSAYIAKECKLCK
jgi:hypothetical protein